VRGGRRGLRVGLARFAALEGDGGAEDGGSAAGRGGGAGRGRAGGRHWPRRRGGRGRGCRQVRAGRGRRGRRPRGDLGFERQLLGHRAAFGALVGGGERHVERAGGGVALAAEEYGHFPGLARRQRGQALGG